jgi:hypothetical protein
MRPLFVLLFCAALAGGPARAHAQDQPAQQPAQPSQVAFQSDAGMIFNQVKPDQTAAFEEVMGKVKEAMAKLAAADDPASIDRAVKELMAGGATEPEARQKVMDLRQVRKQQAASWKVFKSMENAPGGNVLYIFFMDPVVKGAEYDVVKILTEAFPEEVRALYDKLVASLAGMSRVGLQQVVNLSAMEPVPPPVAAPGGSR